MVFFSFWHLKSCRFCSLPDQHSWSTRKVTEVKEQLLQCHLCLLVSQCTCHVDSILAHCLATVFDGDPALIQHWVNTFCAPTFSCSWSRSVSHHKNPADVNSSSTEKLLWRPADFCIKTHHYIIFFVRALHSKPRMDCYCWPSTDQLSG